MRSSRGTRARCMYRYADAVPDDFGHLAVGSPHRLWYERSGASGGIPVVALHGGPGIALEPLDRRLFDPAVFRLTQFDQRGCGRSTPRGETLQNSLWHSVEDIESLRAHSGVERWIVTGHSYGATLALAYAQAHPDRCLALVLRGLYLGTQCERDWIVRGWRMMRPDAWAEATAGFDADEKTDYYGAVARRLRNPDPAVAERAAIAYSRYELTCCYADPDPAVIAAQLDPVASMVNATIAAHHAAHDDFLTDDALLAGMNRLGDVPVIVVTGAADIVTPPYAAWLLRQRWPMAEVRIVARAGHMSTEPGNIDAVTKVMDDLGRRFGGREGRVTGGPAASLPTGHEHTS